MGLVKGSIADTVQFGNRVRPWKSNYKILQTYFTAGSTRGVYREAGAGAGFPAPANGMRVLGARTRAITTLAANTFVYFGLNKCTVDIGFDSGSALTGAVAITPTASQGFGFYNPTGDQSVDFGDNGYVCTVGTFLASEGGGATPGAFTEVLVEIL